MKRPLCFEEINFITEALKFYSKYGPHQTPVAAYNRSSDDKAPGKKVTWWDTPHNAEEIAKIIDGEVESDESIDILPKDGPAAHYLAYIRTYLEAEYDDLEDRLALLRALGLYTAELAEETRNIKFH